MKNLRKYKSTYLFLLGLLNLSLTSPVFNNNFIHTTHSPNKYFSLSCYPQNCTNTTNSCIIIKKDNKIISSFIANNTSGCIFYISNDAKTILQIPTYIGFPEFSYDFRNKLLDKKSTFIHMKVFNESRLIDSIAIPNIVLNKNNHSLISLDNKINSSKVVRIKNDSLAIITYNSIVKFNIKNIKNYKSYDLNRKHLFKFSNLPIKNSKLCTYMKFNEFESCPPRKPFSIFEELYYRFID